jgi:dienelactone hydrolase
MSGFGKCAATLLCAFTFGCQTTPQVGAPSPIFDGRYTFKHRCADDASLSSKFDGSSFIISAGRIANDLAGAGRYVLKEGARVDAKGNLLVEGTRRRSEFAIHGNLLSRRGVFSIASADKMVSGQLGGHIIHNRGKPHSCVAQFERIGDAPVRSSVVGSDSSDAKLVIPVASRNTATDNDLLADIGSEISVKVEFQDLVKIAKNGLAIIVPSSTPNMEDELFYASKMREFGLATAIVHGAEPRFTTKFSLRYTSSMIVRDLVATLDIVSQNLPKPQQIVVLGSSTGAYALFKVAWAGLRDKYARLKQIDKAIMVNAVCPERFEGGWQTEVMIYAANGQEDDSTAAASCAGLVKFRALPNLRRLVYPGAHHFESPRYGPTRQVDGMHIVPTCELHINDQLFTTLRRRDGTANWETANQGAGEAFYGWLGENCVRRGHKQGYDLTGGKMFWSDVRRIVEETKAPITLQGQTR